MDENEDPPLTVEQRRHAARRLVDLERIKRDTASIMAIPDVADDEVFPNYWEQPWYKEYFA